MFSDFFYCLNISNRFSFSVQNKNYNRLFFLLNRKFSISMALLNATKWTFPFFSPLLFLFSFVPKSKLNKDRPNNHTTVRLRSIFLPFCAVVRESGAVFYTWKLSLCFTKCFANLIPFCRLLNRVAFTKGVAYSFFFQMELNCFNFGASS